MNKKRSLFEDLGATQAPPDAPMGTVAWPRYRHGVPKGEPDTALEEKLYSQLRNYFSNKGSSIDPKMVESLAEMLRQGLYPGLLHAPSTTMVYRGMTVSEAWLQKALKTTDIPTSGELDTNFTFSPRKTQVSSWTNSISIADGFAHVLDIALAESGYYAVVMHAPVNKNVGRLIACPEGLYDVLGFGQYDDEEEVLGLFDIKVTSIEWSPP